MTLRGPIPECLGEAATKNIDPVDNVSLAHIIIANEDYRLILRVARDVLTPAIPSCRIYEMGSEELMVENPISFTILFDLLTSNFPSHHPFSNQFFQQFILKDAVLTVNFHRGTIS